MAVNLSPVGGVAAQFFDNSGQVLTGGKLYTYLAGTTTPAVTYTTNSGLTANSNPIVLNAAGRIADSGEIWLTDGISYKFVLKDSNDVQIAVWDNIIGINSNFVNYTLQEQTFTATQGQTVFTLTGGLQYTPATNNLSVFVNGSKQVAGTNYLETSTTVFTFVTGLNVGDVVDAITAIPVATNVISSVNVSYNQGGTGAVTTNVQAKLAQTVSIKDFGAVGNGITDDTTAFNNAISTFTSANNPIQINLGNSTYKITSGLTFDPLLIKFIGQSATLNFSTMTSGVALTLTGTGSANGIFGTCMRDVKIVGPGISSNVDGIYFNSTIGKAILNLGFYGVDVSYFRSGHLYGNYTWNIFWYNCTVGYCNKAVNIPTATTTSGENVVYENSLIYNSNGGLNLQSANWDIRFVNCSIDAISGYSVYQTASLAFFTNCHFESGAATITNPPFYVDQTGGDTTLQITGGNIYINCTTAGYMFSVNTTPNSGTGVLVDGVYINYGLTGINYLATGTGDFLIRNTFTNITNGFLSLPLLSSAANTLALDGTFENGLQDDISISIDNTPITNRYTGTSLALSRSSAQAHTGTYSLAALRNAVASGQASFQIAYPLDFKQSRIGLSLWYNIPSGITASGVGSGSVFLNLLWAGGEQYSSYGVPTFTKQQLPNVTYWQKTLNNSNYSAGGWRGNRKKLKIKN